MILALNTSTETFSMVSATHSGETIKEISITPPEHGRLKHSDLIVEKAKEVLAGISPEKIQKVACTIGPGSFTGIRTGLAFARTLCQYYSIPLVGLKTDVVLAQRVKLYLSENTLNFLLGKRGNKGDFHSHLYICPLIPASLNEIYVSLFSVAPTTQIPKEIIPCQTIQFADFKKFLSATKQKCKEGNLILTGDWVIKNKGYRIFENSEMPSLAAALISLAAHLKGSQFHRVGPFYLTPPHLR
ncbi:MAG: tRNA (adenosine(37)-N6)-threonylcarbamoyltransferase complex dimerization subunit type 1 TsaB [Elusimicrobiota bacterium]